MATLLHIDSSVFPGEASSSRSVTAAFRKTWEEQHPEGTVIYRDLAADPVPQLRTPVELVESGGPVAVTVLDRRGTTSSCGMRMGAG